MMSTVLLKLAVTFLRSTFIDCLTFVISQKGCIVINIVDHLSLVSYL